MASTGEVWKLGHRPALDGVRGVAILLVVASHSGFLPGGTTGAIGVTLFFVLSGFLITTVLMGRESNLASFYAARAARLLPALVLMVVPVSLWLVATGHSVGWVSERAGTALLYVENFFHAAHDGEPLAHAWSLAVEEQFYLVWPFVLPLILRRSAAGRAGVILWAAGLLLAFRLTVGDDDFAYASLPTNAYAMLAGAGLAVLPRPQVNPRLTIGAGLVSLAALVAVAPTFQGGTVTAAPWAVVPGLLLVLGGIQGGRLLEQTWLRFAGRISYSWYLWHWPLLILAGTVNGRLDALWVVVVSFGIASASTLLLEEPLRRWWRQRTVPSARLAEVLDGEVERRRGG